MKIAIIFFIGLVAFASAQIGEKADQYLPEENGIDGNVPEQNVMDEFAPEQLGSVQNQDDQDNFGSVEENVMPNNSNNQGGPKEYCTEAKLYRNPENCGTFYNCGIGHVPYLMECPSGLLFNEKIKVCDWPQNVQC